MSTARNTTPLLGAFWEAIENYDGYVEIDNAARFSHHLRQSLAVAPRYELTLSALRSHVFPTCELCGAAVDDPEAWEPCEPLPAADEAGSVLAPWAQKDR